VKLQHIARNGGDNRSVSRSHDVERIVMPVRSTLVVETVDEILCSDSCNRNDHSRFLEGVEIGRSYRWM
jgi:hypothetical protein